MDGLNTTNYKVLGIDKKPLYTNIRVQIPGPKNDYEVAAYFKLATELFFRKVYGNNASKSQDNNENESNVEIRPNAVKPKLETLSPQAKKRQLPSMIRKENIPTNNTEGSDKQHFSNQTDKLLMAGQNYVENTINKRTAGQLNKTPNGRLGGGVKDTGNTNQQKNPQQGGNPVRYIRPISITGGKYTDWRNITVRAKGVPIQNRDNIYAKDSPKLINNKTVKEFPWP